MKTLSQKQLVLNELQLGYELSTDDIVYLTNAGNPHAIIHLLRQEGYPIYLNDRNEQRFSLTSRVKKYRLGSPSKSIIAAGYRARAAGLY